MKLDELRKKYPSGTDIVLDNMDDIQAPPIGTHGVIQYIDDMNGIHVRWDNGSSLALILEAGDRFHIV